MTNEAAGNTPGRGNLQYTFQWKHHSNYGNCTSTTPNQKLALALTLALTRSQFLSKRGMGRQSYTLLNRSMGH